MTAVTPSTAPTAAFSQWRSIQSYQSKSLLLVGSEVPVKVSDVDVAGECTKLITATTPTTIAATTSIAVTALTKTTVTLTCAAADATLIIQSHRAHISAFVSCVCVCIVKLRLGMQVGN